MDQIVFAYCICNYEKTYESVKCASKTHLVLFCIKSQPKSNNYCYYVAILYYCTKLLFIHYSSLFLSTIQNYKKFPRISIAFDYYQCIKFLMQQSPYTKCLLPQK